MTETDGTRMSADYADNELELFRKTMDLIVGSENSKVSSTDILNSANTMTTRKLKKSKTEHLLNLLVNVKWLCEEQAEKCGGLLSEEIKPMHTPGGSCTY